MTGGRKGLLAAAGLVVVAAGAYSIGRVYPPIGPIAGTIAPADRYVESQIGDADVELGDTSVPQLMQTDVYEVMVKNPNFRALASDPGFAALAQNPQAMAAIAANPQAFSALAKNANAFQSLARAAAATSSAAMAANAAQA